MLERKEFVLMTKSEKFSGRIIRMYKHLKDARHEHVLSKQILRSGTSIGANIAESRRAQSELDFISKLHIALKEAEETEYWLKCLNGGGYITEEEFCSMNRNNEELIRMLVSSIKTTKARIGK